MKARISSLSAAALSLTALSVAAAEVHVPEAKAVQAAVAKSLTKQPHYQSGDLITQSSIAAALECVAQETGWRLPPKDAETLVKRGVEDRSFLAKELSTKEGRAFARQIGRFQLSFDHLDRLSTMPQGRSTVERLIHGPDGYKLLEYMATAKGGHELAKMLSNAPRGKNFEAATGRIYVEAQLNAALEKQRQAAAKSAVVPRQSP